MIGGVENPEFPPVITGRGEEDAVETKSWDEVLDDGLLLDACVSYSSAGSSVLFGRWYEFQSISSEFMLARNCS